MQVKVSGTPQRYILEVVIHTRQANGFAHIFDGTIELPIQVIQLGTPIPIPKIFRRSDGVEFCFRLRITPQFEIDIEGGCKGFIGAQAKLFCLLQESVRQPKTMLRHTMAR